MRRSFADETGIAGQEAAFWERAAQAADHPDALAIVLMGGGLRTGGSVARLEASLGKPVIAATAALVWHACELLGANPPRPHLGRLFGAPPARAPPFAAPVFGHQGDVGHVRSADLWLGQGRAAF